MNDHRELGQTKQKDFLTTPQAEHMLLSFSGYLRHLGTAGSLLHRVSSKKCHDADVFPPS